MKRIFTSKRLGLVFIIVVIVVGLALVSVQAGSNSAPDKAGPCCFTNDRYSGVCKVYPTGDETCGDILAYLNNPMATGKTYCGNTHIRGGWTQVDCKE
ncbi:MAG: hypothetical protein GXP47_09675 [Acidobacteria bacterium]|nr:hypothetical protein [Acidobacteriota bacterium]